MPDRPHGPDEVLAVAARDDSGLATAFDGEGGVADRLAVEATAHVQESSATIWFGDPDSPGGRTTLRACADLVMPTILVIEGLTKPSYIVARIESEEVRVLNCAANQTSKAEGLGDRVERFLVAILRLPAEGQVQSSRMFGLARSFLPTTTHHCADLPPQAA